MSDPNNPSGTLPGDPRYGLSEEELRAYYREKSQTWIVRGMLKANGGIEARLEAMDPHIAYLRASRDRIRFSGPLMADDGETPTGSLTLLDAPDRASAEAWLAEEPYNMNDAFGSVSFQRWSSSMQLRQHDYPRTEGWEQFAITAIDAPDGEARRAACAEDHHRFQATVMDRYIARGPMFDDDCAKMVGSFFLIEVPDRAACDDFIAGEPMVQTGVFESVTIECWRYGLALG